MDSWWNRLQAKIRRISAGGLNAESGGAAALTVSRSLSRAMEQDRPQSTESRPSIWQRIKARREAAATVRQPDVAATLQQLVERVTQLCTLLEQQAAAAPGVRVEQLRDVVASQCEQVRQLTTVLAGVPAALRTQTETLANQRQTLDNLISHAVAARDRQGETVEKLSSMDRKQMEVCKTMEGVAKTVEEGATYVQSQSQTLGQFLHETRGQQVRVQETMHRHSRRATILAGFAIGLAAAASVFSAIGLYLRLTGG